MSITLKITQTAASKKAIMISLILVLLSHAVIVDGSKFGVNCTASDIASQAERPASEVRGGRNVPDCDANCRERYDYGIVCYSDVGWQYDVFWWLLVAIFSICFVRSLHCLYIMKRMEKDKMIKLNPQFLIALLTILTLVLRYIFLGTIYNGRTNDVLVGGAVFNSLLVQVGQCIMFSEFFLIVLVWRTIVDASSKMKTIDKNIDHKNYRQAGLFILFTFLTLVPMNIAGNFIPIVGVMGYLLEMILVLILVGGAIMYSIRLRALLKGTMVDKKKRGAIESIMHVVVASAVMASIAFLLLIPEALNYLVEPHLKMWIWWFIIHVCEASWLWMLVSSASYKARAAYREGKALDKYFDTNASGGGSTASGTDNAGNMSSTSNVNSTKTKSKQPAVNSKIDKIEVQPSATEEI